MQTIRRRRGIAAAAALIVTAGTVQAFSSASATVPPSVFEGNDGNYTVDTAGNKDWVSSGINLVVKNDIATGQLDNSFGEGSKENNVDVHVGTGSIPNSKADLGRFYVGNEQIGGDTMLYLGWARNNLSGTTNFDFEINKAAQPNMVTSGDKTLIRTAGDLLVMYDFQGGAQKPTLQIREWTGTEWGAANPLDATEGESEVNRVPIVDNLSGPPVNRPAFTFGEASINLTKAGVFTPGVCESFGSIFVKSRASDAFTATLKDFIAPEAVTISNCGGGIIRKETLPDGTAGDFGFTHDVSTTPATASPFTLQDGTSQPFTNVALGTYTIDESSLPAGWSLTGLDCSASTGFEDGELVTSLADGTVTVTINSSTDVFDCTYTNTAAGNIIITKSTSPSGSDQAFGFDPSWSDEDFELKDGESHDSGPLSPGSYSVSETVPDGWENLEATCSDGSPIDQIDVDPGETVTCTFLNEQDAHIIVVKEISGPGSGSFDFTTDYGDPFTLIVPGGPTQNDSGALDPGTYSVTEAAQANWKLLEATCDDGSEVDAIALSAGETVTCTFVNEWQVGALRIHKDAKHAAADGGVKPLAGVTFDVTDANDVVNSFVTDANGDICVDNWAFQTLTVHEQTPNGYAAQPDQDVDIDSVSYCDGSYGGAPEQANFTNVPLTNVEIKVTSQIDGGTATIVNCNGTPVETDEHGNLTLPFNNLSPTAPDATLTCTVTVDP